ncbi:hypothetical protein AXF42_Ash008328 [Apostasia shenzhenica]|uniref:Reverse transcriptase RNase H-like domain-containing protein n=1 Tax=Apostasia shenzhenica TaxID=1088818 RepID=A0A2I0AXK1_9ASPA|nr:hypothetical protein AXF42_Ash008328 [Apostasia shenzhenica]
MSPLVLAAPTPARLLILYTAALDESLRAFLAQHNEENNEMALYYLNRRMIGAKIRYSSIQKHCLELIFAVQKLRHYLLAHKVTLISRIDSQKVLMTQPMLTERLAQWALLL